MNKLLSPILAAVLLAAPSAALAATFQTVITFEPTGATTSGQGPTSTNPADGNRVVLDWVTDTTSGQISAGDLSFLSFSLFGTGGLIFEDIAIQNGLPTPLGGLDRVIDQDIDFLFDFDEFNDDPSDGLLNFDNDFDLLSLEATGVTYNIFYEDFVALVPFIDAVRYEDGAINLAQTVVNDGGFTTLTTQTAAIPLPGALVLLLGGLVGLTTFRRVAA